MSSLVRSLGGLLSRRLHTSSPLHSFRTFSPSVHSRYFALASQSYNPNEVSELYKQWKKNIDDYNNSFKSPEDRDFYAKNILSSTEYDSHSVIKRMEKEMSALKKAPETAEEANAFMKTLKVVLNDDPYLKRIIASVDPADVEKMKKHISSLDEKGKEELKNEMRGLHKNYDAFNMEQLESTELLLAGDKNPTVTRPQRVELKRQISILESHINDILADENCDIQNLGILLSAYHDLNDTQKVNDLLGKVQKRWPSEAEELKLHIRENKGVDLDELPPVVLEQIKENERERKEQLKDYKRYKHYIAAVGHHFD